MKIKPIYEKSYVISFRRGSDIQTTEVVEADWKEVHTLIAETFCDRFRKPISREKVPATQIQIVELDNARHKSHIIEFVHTKDGKDFKRPRVLVFNLSPREARIQFEKAINNYQ